jgi:hypothetical protein
MSAVYHFKVQWMVGGSLTATHYRFGRWWLTCYWRCDASGLMYSRLGSAVMLWSGGGKPWRPITASNLWYMLWCTLILDGATNVIVSCLCYYYYCSVWAFKAECKTRADLVISFSHLMTVAKRPLQQFYRRRIRQAKEQENGKMRNAITKYALQTGGGRGILCKFALLCLFSLPYSSIFVC